MFDNAIFLAASFAAMSAGLSATVAKVSPTIGPRLRHLFAGTAPIAAVLGMRLTEADSVTLRQIMNTYWHKVPAEERAPFDEQVRAQSDACAVLRPSHPLGRTGECATAGIRAESAGTCREHGRRRAGYLAAGRERRGR